MIRDYTCLEGQNIYDLAALLYQDVRGLELLVNDNPEVFRTPLISKDFEGEIIQYDDSVVFDQVQSETLIQPREFLADWITVEGQTVYDLAVMLYGDMSEGLRELLPLLNDVGELGDEIPAGVPVVRKVPTNRVGKIYQANEWVVATFYLSDQGSLNNRIFDFPFGISFN